jgi:hypothetical protein
LHNQKCTENFYQRHVTDEIKLVGNVQVCDVNAMKSILTRMHKSNSEQSEEVTALMIERLEELALLPNDELSLESLNEHEKKVFMEQIKAGKLSKFVAMWKPWWFLRHEIYESETKVRRESLIMEITSDNISKGNFIPEKLDEEVAVIETPIYPAEILTKSVISTLPQQMNQLSKSAPSPLLKYNLVEILFSYVIVLRIYNGDRRVDIDGFALEVLGNSGVLRDNLRFADSEAVIRSCLERYSGIYDENNNLEMAKVALCDVSVILQWRTFTLDALTDLLYSFRELLAEDNVSHSTKKSLFLVEKKIFYYLVWAFNMNFRKMESVAMALKQIYPESQTLS